MDDTLQRKTLQRFASLCVSIKAIPTASSETRREAFILPLIRVSDCCASEATQSKDTPNPCDVKENEA